MRQRHKHAAIRHVLHTTFAQREAAALLRSTAVPVGEEELWAGGAGTGLSGGGGATRTTTATGASAAVPTWLLNTPSRSAASLRPAREEGPLPVLLPLAGSTARLRYSTALLPAAGSSSTGSLPRAGSVAWSVQEPPPLRQTPHSATAHEVAAARLNAQAFLQGRTAFVAAALTQHFAPATTHEEMHGESRGTPAGVLLPLTAPATPHSPLLSGGSAAGTPAFNFGPRSPAPPPPQPTVHSPGGLTGVQRRRFAARTIQRNWRGRAAARRGTRAAAADSALPFMRAPQRSLGKQQLRAGLASMRSIQTKSSTVLKRTASRGSSGSGRRSLSPKSARSAASSSSRDTAAAPYTGDAQQLLPPSPHLRSQSLPFRQAAPGGGPPQPGVADGRQPRRNLQLNMHAGASAAPLGMPPTPTKPKAAASTVPTQTPAASAPTQTPAATAPSGRSGSSADSPSKALPSRKAPPPKKGPPAPPSRPKPPSTAPAHKRGSVLQAIMTGADDAYLFAAVSDTDAPSDGTLFPHLAARGAGGGGSGGEDALGSSADSELDESALGIPLGLKARLAARGGSTPQHGATPGGSSVQWAEQAPSSGGSSGGDDSMGGQGTAASTTIKGATRSALSPGSSSGSKRFSVAEFRRTALRRPATRDKSAPKLGQPAAKSAAPDSDRTHSLQ